MRGKPLKSLMIKTGKQLSPLEGQEPLGLIGTLGTLWLAAVLSSTATVAFAQHPGGAFSSIMNSVQGARTGNAGDKEENPGGGNGSTSSAVDYFVDNVEPVVQGDCIICHRQGLVAESQGARLLFSGDALSNEQATFDFVSISGVGADWLLGKVVGELNHGGGPVLTRGGDKYNALAEYLTLATGANTSGGDQVSTAEFWEGTQLESRERTLRRAGILLAGEIPTNAMINRASQSDAALRSEILKFMDGDGFHNFLVTGANDRLLTDGLNRGIDFQFDFRGRFPEFAAFQATLPERYPEELEGYYFNKPFMTRGDAAREFRWAVVREPAELIADIVMTNQSYKKVVTADYTMVNPMSAMAYRSDAEFDDAIVDSDGFYDRQALNTFQRGKNDGHVPRDEEYWWDDEANLITGFSGYNEWPHAGVLSTPAWLSRYPSTDTNRNRARARWTYFHFLGVDIEKSAPRSTDAAALADTNNPTMNNPACTVCHERMDPVAGAYQSFGDQGHYLDQWGGMDSLPDTYKHPPRPAGEMNELVRDADLNRETLQFYERSTEFTTNGGGELSLNDLTTRACLQDEENSTEDRWVGWCSHMGLEWIKIYKGSKLVVDLDANEFRNDARFSSQTWTDRETGEEHECGWDRWEDDRQAYFVCTNNWMAFTLDLEPGTYDVDLSLASYMTDGHPNDSITVGLAWTEGAAKAAEYQYGDTWYRDMRTPGFEGSDASGNLDSLQWLGRQIANDPRFGPAAVVFWWPSIFGEEALSRPEDPGLPGYQGKLLAYNAQQALITDLAQKFEASGFKAKQLLADMMMSAWFRVGSVDDEGLNAMRRKSLESVGSGRLLTPEELDRKNRAVFGRTWGERSRDNAYYYEPETQFNRGWGGYSTFYGGIDSVTVTKRNRDMTSLMSNVVEKMGVDLACQVVLDEFSKPAAARHVFTHVESTTHPMRLGGKFHELERTAPLEQQKPEFFQRKIPFSTKGGKVNVRFSDVSPQGCLRNDEESTDDQWVGWCSHVGLESVEIFQGTRRVASVDGDGLQDHPDFTYDMWYNNETGDSGPRGYTSYDDGIGFWLGHTGAWFAIDFDLSAGDYEVRYNLVSTADEGHPQPDVSVDVSVKSYQFDPQGEGAKLVGKQLKELYSRGFGTDLTANQVRELAEAISSYADEAAARDNWFQGNCRTWEMWTYEDYTDQEWRELMNLVNRDSNGMKMAWTMLVNALLVNPAYLHD